MAVEIASSGPQLLFAADAIVLPLHLQFPENDWCHRPHPQRGGYDQNRTAPGGSEEKFSHLDLLLSISRVRICRGERSYMAMAANRGREGRCFFCA